MIVGELTNIVSQVSDPADQSSDNLNVIATVFSSTTSLIASGNISVSDTVSIIVCINYLPVVHIISCPRNNLPNLFASISICKYHILLQFVENTVVILDGITDWPQSVLEQQSSG